MSTAGPGPYPERFIQEIQIKASAARIFEAITSPRELVLWWGVEGKFQATAIESDLRPGGHWRMQLVAGNGTRSAVSGEYREIRPPWLLSFTWNREQEGSPETLVRWELDEKIGLTTVRVTHSGFASEEQRTRNSGWPTIVELLKTHVEGAANGQGEGSASGGKDVGKPVSRKG